MIEYSIITGGLYRDGKQVGSNHNAGYLTLWHKGKQWLAHRLVYVLLGLEPPQNVDHANGDRKDNRWLNLREADARLNQEARHVVVGASGFMGVYLRADTGKYQAKIKSHGKTRNLGCFNTPQEASAAYLLAKEELHSLHPKPD